MKVLLLLVIFLSGVASKDVWDVVFSHPNLQIFSLAIRVADIKPPFELSTVWAPHDDAFLLIPEAALNALFSSPETLRKYVSLHITPGRDVSGEQAIWNIMRTMRRPEDDHEPGAWGFTTPSEPEILKGVFKAGLLCLLAPKYSLDTHSNVCTVVANDLLASNGRVHIIDHMLFPEDWRICETHNDCLEGEVCTVPQLAGIDNCDAKTCFGDIGAVRAKVQTLAANATAKIQTLSNIPGDSSACPCLMTCEDCHQQDQYCSDSTDCCDGLLCSDGQCAPCRDVQHTCDPWEEETTCCPGYSCDYNTATCCAPLLGNCMDHTDCCSGMYCDADTWLCVAAMDCVEALQGERPSGIYPIWRPLDKYADPDRDMQGVGAEIPTRCAWDDRDPENPKIWTMFQSFTKLESVQFDEGLRSNTGVGEFELHKKEHYAWSFEWEDQATIIGNNAWVAASCQDFDEFEAGEANDIIFPAAGMFEDTDCATACIGVDPFDWDMTTGTGNDLNKGGCYLTPLWLTEWRNEDHHPGLPGDVTTRPVQYGGGGAGQRCSESVGNEDSFPAWTGQVTTTFNMWADLVGANDADFKCGEFDHSLTSWWAGSYADSSCVDKKNGDPCGPLGRDRCISSLCIRTRCDFSEYRRGADVVMTVDTPCTTPEWSYVSLVGRCYWDTNAGAAACGAIIETSCTAETYGMPCDIGGEGNGHCVEDKLDSTTYVCANTVKDCYGQPGGQRCTYAGDNRNEMGWCTGSGTSGTAPNVCAVAYSGCGATAWAGGLADGTLDSTETGKGFTAATLAPTNRACILQADFCPGNSGYNDWGTYGGPAHVFGYCVSAAGCAENPDGTALIDQC
eukprot:TRINITY_DN93621_c0_g1_i1.p1 TRINITY_DN93621_c0_g1~~TRINITY_DN93621_c0_g1_i1.p1  ORF type:complete len:858 (-),score=104.28 TRINITY_DN93621_c0_g1_i1:96-2630(-)